MIRCQRTCLRKAPGVECWALDELSSLMCGLHVLLVVPTVSPPPHT